MLTRQQAASHRIPVRNARFWLPQVKRHNHLNIHVPIRVVAGFWQNTQTTHVLFLHNLCDAGLSGDVPAIASHILASHLVATFSPSDMMFIVVCVSC